MPNRNRNINQMSLSTAGFSPAVFSPIEFKPVEANFNMLDKALAKQEERKQKAAAQQSAIQAAIAQVELAPEEDEWKQNYINNINNQINAASEVGDYAGALETATRLAGSSAVDPALLGRERYNRERQEWLKHLEVKRDKGLISDDSYERAIAQNTYNYKDITNDSGRIVGGSKWTPDFNPLNDINLKDVLAEMQAFMGVSSETTGSSGGTSQTYYDINGKATTKQDEAISIRGIKKGGSRTESNKEVTVDDWRKAYDAYIARHPEDEARLNQLWENARYNFATLTNKANNQDVSPEDRAEAKRRADNFWSSLTDDQGGLISKDDWLLKQISPSFEVMAYKQHSLITEAGSNLLDETTLKNRTIASVHQMNAYEAELYANGVPMEVIIQNRTVENQTLNNDAKQLLFELEDLIDEDDIVVNDSIVKQ